jgi:hypothetical protein
VRSFRPDETVARRAQLEIDGTRIELIPTPGGETRDALLVYLPAQRLLFGGDFIMPYLGAPFAEEGSTEGLLASLAQIEALAPERVLHGHEGINRLFSTNAALFGIRRPLAWLAREVDRRMARGLTRAAIHHENLVPHDLLRQTPDAVVPYLVLREHFINRRVDRKRGYWRPGFAGADTLTRRELGAILTHYADLSESDQIAMVERMVQAGDHELALRTLEWLLPHRPTNEALLRLRRETLLSLVARSQTIDAFKLIWYGGAMDFDLGPIQRGPDASSEPRERSDAQSSATDR